MRQLDARPHDAFFDVMMDPALAPTSAPALLQIFSFVGALTKANLMSADANFRSSFKAAVNNNLTDKVCTTVEHDFHMEEFVA